MIAFGVQLDTSKTTSLQLNPELLYHERQRKLRIKNQGIMQDVRILVKTLYISVITSPYKFSI